MRSWGRSKRSLLFNLLRRRDFCAGRKQPSKRLKLGGSEGTVFSSCVGSHRLTLLWRFGGERRRRERQARSDLHSRWVTYLPLFDPLANRNPRQDFYSMEIDASMRRLSVGAALSEAGSQYSA